MKSTEVNIQSPSSVTLRPVGPADEAFLLDVYAGTRADELALVSWSEERRQTFVRMQFTAQQEHYRKAHPEANHDIILLGGRPVGRLYVARKEREIRIVDIALLPPQRNAGVGSYLMRGLLDESARAGKPLRVYVESFNPSLRLFERLGFYRTGQNGMHILMQWDP
jgi:ribosomal protein S18 acetylase RimI-like enzyme